MASGASPLPPFSDLSSLTDLDSSTLFHMLLNEQVKMQWRDSFLFNPDNYRCVQLQQLNGNEQQISEDLEKVVQIKLITAELEELENSLINVYSESAQLILQ